MLLPDEAVVLAPTGLAAVNVGGQTIHSFFGLPPRLIRPEDIRRSRNGAVMRRLKFLVVDEVSMVRADLMWAIDQALRVNRGAHASPSAACGSSCSATSTSFPVVQEAEVAAHLESEFGGPFFFSLSSLREAAGTSLLELTQVFRQRDEALLSALDGIREGEADEDTLALLNTRVHPLRTLAQGQEFVILTPTNAAAQRINMAYLDALPGPLRTYAAGITGEFSESAHPTDVTLRSSLAPKLSCCATIRTDAGSTAPLLASRGSRTSTSSSTSTGGSSK